MWHNCPICTSILENQRCNFCGLFEVTKHGAYEYLIIDGKKYPSSDLGKPSNVIIDLLNEKRVAYEQLNQRINRLDKHLNQQSKRIKEKESSTSTDEDPETVWKRIEDERNKLI